MKQQSLKETFHKLLVSPNGADIGEVDTLIQVFPYSRALWFIKAKMEISSPEIYPRQEAVTRAALMAGDDDILVKYLYADTPYIQTIDMDPVDASQLPDENERTTETVTIPNENTDQTIPTIDFDQTTGIEEQDTIVHQEEDIDTQAADSLPSEDEWLKLEDESIKEIAAIEEISENADKKKEVSKYDDEHMPYSFLWWLHKTRIAYADTYQPYSSHGPHVPKQQKPGNESDTYLDHQIKEHIFNLQAPEKKLSVQEPEQTKESRTFHIASKTDDIINRFIKEEPQITPPSADKITLENKARKSAEDESTFVTETLANIYIQQGLYHKAEDTYIKLSLKYPEKSAYFADRIKEIRK